MVTFMSRWDFKKRAIPVLNKDLHAVISFSDNSLELEDMRSAIPSEVPSFLCVAKDDEKDFSLSLGKEIVKFVEKNKDKYFVIHCFAGISRSAATARWIELYLKGGLSPLLKTYTLYNKFVFSQLEKAHANVKGIGIPT